MFPTRPGAWLDRVERAMAAAAIFILVAVTASVCLEVVMRYGFNAPLVWVVEIGEYALVYITFLGTAWTLGRGGHVRVDVLVGRFGRRWQTAFGVIGSTLGLGVSVVLTLWGALATWSHFMRGTYKPTVIEVPTWTVLVVIPIGSLFLCVRFLRQLSGRAADSPDAGTSPPAPD